MKYGGETLAKRFSSIMFLHLVEGRGDFDGKSFRIHALINSVKKKKGLTRGYHSTRKCYANQNGI